MWITPWWAEHHHGNTQYNVLNCARKFTTNRFIFFYVTTKIKRKHEISYTLEKIMPYLGRRNIRCRTVTIFAIKLQLRSKLYLSNEINGVNGLVSNHIEWKNRNETDDREPAISCMVEQVKKAQDIDNIEILSIILTSYIDSLYVYNISYIDQSYDVFRRSFIIGISVMKMTTNVGLYSWKLTFSKLEIIWYCWGDGGNSFDV